jgi:hypothetical protein
MDNKTARKYGDFKALSSGQAPAHWNYRTRLDSFPGVRQQVQERLEAEPGMQATRL